jgi:hypothetical protein
MPRPSLARRVTVQRCGGASKYHPTATEKVANRNVWDFEIAHAAVSRRPPISLDTMVPRTEVHARCEIVGVVHRPRAIFSRPRQTLIVTIRDFFIAVHRTDWTRVACARTGPLRAQPVHARAQQLRTAPPWAIRRREERRVGGRHGAGRGGHLPRNHPGLSLFPTGILEIQRGFQQGA